MFPRIDLEVSYTWAGTFGETKDGLAYIGQTPEFPHAYFALGYGGNGITFSVIAAKIITDLHLVDRILMPIFSGSIGSHDIAQKVGGSLP